MKEFQARVVEEAKNLEEKLIKLQTWNKGEGVKKLPEDEQNRLVGQENYMTGYLAVLKDRIAHFEE